MIPQKCLQTARRLSSGARIDIPINMGLPGYLESEGKWSQRVGQTALKDAVTGRELHYDKLRSCITACGEGLVKDGVQKLMMFLPNCPEYLVTMLGAASRGIPVSTASPIYTHRELEYQMKDSGCNMVLTTPQMAGVAYQAVEYCGLPRSAVKILGEAGTEYFGVRSASGLEEPDFKGVTVDVLNDTAVLPYSSGTTGLPKGVMLSHYNIISNVAQLTKDVDIKLAADENSVLLCVLPLYHIYAMVICGFAPLSLGAKIVTMPKFDPEHFLSTVEKEKVTVSPVVPPIMIFLSKHPSVDDYDLSSLKVLYSAAAPCDAPLQKSVCDRLNVAAVQAYGMTELSPAATATPVKNLLSSGYTDKSELAFGSCGKALANTDLRIVSLETGEVLGVGEEGELHVRGPQVMQGYYNRPDATAETIIDGGWLRTGDIFKYDENGNYYAVDRLKELIKVKGNQVAPAELEGLLLTHPAVRDCAVIPMRDEMSGELPRACVVLKPEMTATAEELITFCAEETVSYKRIARVEFVESIPKTPSGKILRRVLKDQYRNENVVAA
eukprot:TRINITY_DN5030_c0_g2_i1.p1 TRINITY_DN5030_c0_g2~~TRINITY_DN5030_c0_g2_i1.p1  ORF type:complete len:565 (+),score=97.45 TRINITY_DN5030_c0_g2_i1:38-1696(+)